MSKGVNRLLLSSVAGVALILGGCESTGPTAGGSEVVAQAGSDRFGDACHTVNAGRVGVAGATAAFDVLCGGSGRRSGRVIVAETALSPASLAAKSDWRDTFLIEADCGEPVPAVLFDGVPVEKISCVWRTSGQPFTAFATGLGGRTYLADTIPSADTAVARVIADLAGLPAPAAVTLAGADQPVLYRADDLAAISQLLAEAEADHRRSNFAAAEERYRQALQITERLAKNHGRTAFLLTSLGLMLSNQVKFDQAEAQFDRAAAELDLATKKAEFGFDDEQQRTRLTSALATHLVNKGDPDRLADAAALGEDATARWEREAGEAGVDIVSRPDALSEFSVAGGDAGAPQPVPVVLANIDLIANDTLQGRVARIGALIGQDKLVEARRELEHAAANLRSVPVSEQNWGPQVALLTGVVAHREGDREEAARHYAAAAERQGRIEDGSRQEGVAHLFHGLVLVELGQTDNALAVYRRAIDVIQTSGGGIRAEELMPYFKAILAKAEKAPQQRDALFTEAFEAAQMVTGSETAKIVAASAVQLAAADSEVGRRLKDLETMRRDLNTVTRDLDLAQGPASVTTAEEIKGIVAERDRLRAAIVAAEAQTAVDFPQYNQLRSRPVDQAAIRGELKEDEALILLLLSDRGSAGLVVDRSGILLYPIGPRVGQVAKAVSALRYAVEEPDPDSPDDERRRIVPAFDVEKAHELYTALLGPVASRLDGKRHLIIVPTGPLLSLPPQVLVTAPVRQEGSDYRDVPWLANDFVLTVAPSVQSVNLLRQVADDAGARRPYIGFGDFVPSGDEDRILGSLKLTEQCRGEASTIANAPRLPATRQEISEAARLFGAGGDATILGQEFTASRLREALDTRYGVVHFATHGLLSGRFQCLPEPALTTTASDGDDGLLLASEISTFDMNGAIVVLSACDSGGSGGRTGGESLSGLAQAFYLARARSLLVTHWPVIDQLTAELVASTLGYLAAGDVTLAEALDRGQRSIRSRAELSHPWFWAAFTVVGDGEQRLAATRTIAAPQRDTGLPALAVQ